MTDRRAAHRYDLSLRAVVHAPCGNAVSQEAKTRDVSTRGVYLLFDRDVPRDGDFELTMALPTTIAGSPGASVRAVGRIVRVEEWIEDGNPRVGVGAVIRRYEIVRNQRIAS